MLKTTFHSEHIAYLPAGSLTKVSKQVKIQAVRCMELRHLTVELRPELYRYLEERAEHAGVSTDRYAAMSLEWIRAKDTDKVKEGEEEVEPYPIEELYREIDEARKDLKNGKLKVYHSADEMFKSLGI